MGTGIRSFALVVVVGCNPTVPGDGADGSGGSSSGTDATTGSSGSTETPTASTSTGEVEACAWYRPEYEDLRFCPVPSTMSADVSGMTPFGPKHFKLALFGLMLCASCPEAEDPALVLYSAPPGVDPEDPTADFIRLYIWTSFGDGSADGDARIDGDRTNFNSEVEITVELSAIPGEEETSPPLNQAAPPVLAGTVTIVGDGWDLGGSFAATLCNDLNWSVSCE